MAIVGHFDSKVLTGTGSSPALDAVAADIKTVKTDVATIKTTTATVNTNVTANGVKLTNLQGDVTIIKEQTAPTTG